MEGIGEVFVFDRGMHPLSFSKRGERACVGWSKWAAVRVATCTTPWGIRSMAAPAVSSVPGFVRLVPPVTYI